MHKKESINKITLRGTITTTRMPNTTMAIYGIATDGDKGSSVFPEVIHNVSGPEEAWRIGDHVTAVCHARSGKKVNGSGRTVYVKQIVADSVIKTERILSSYLDDIPDEGAMPSDINEFIFCGEVYRVTENPGGRNAVLVTLKIPAEKQYINYVEVVGFKHTAEVMKTAEPGDYLAVAGAVRTLQKNRKIAFDYVAKDVYVKRKESE